MNNQELIDSGIKISKESFVDVYYILQDAENAFIKIEEDSSLTRRALKRLCITAISILTQQYEEKDLLKFMDSRNHWKIPLSSKDEIKREITNLMKQVIENSEHKTGISMKPIFRLWATAKKDF